MSELTPILPGGLFGFSYPNLHTGATGVGTPEGYVKRFAAGKHNPSEFKAYADNWPAQDIRRLNPHGAYFKHVNLVFAKQGQIDPQVEGRPSALAIDQWVVRNSSGSTVGFANDAEILLDFGNDDYLNWVVSEFQHILFDRIDWERWSAALPIYLQQDNGTFFGLPKATGTPYATDEGMQAAWVKMLARIKGYWPHVSIIINVAVNDKPADVQLAACKRVLSACDGAYFEYLLPPTWVGDRANFMRVMGGIAEWCAANDKFFFVNPGLWNGVAPTPQQIADEWAFFTAIRGNGSKFIFAPFRVDPANGQAVPIDIPQMEMAPAPPAPTPEPPPPPPPPPVPAIDEAAIRRDERAKCVAQLQAMAAAKQAAALAASRKLRDPLLDGAKALIEAAKALDGAA